MSNEKSLNIGTSLDNAAEVPQQVGALDDKNARIERPSRDIEIQDGHLVELEVDLSRVLIEDAEKEGDWDEDTSPFAAVRAVVPETDDPEMPVNTFRAWFLGIVCTFLLHDRESRRLHTHRSSSFLVPG